MKAEISSLAPPSENNLNVKTLVKRFPVKEEVKAETKKEVIETLSKRASQLCEYMRDLEVSIEHNSKVMQVVTSYNDKVRDQRESIKSNIKYSKDQSSAIYEKLEEVKAKQNQLEMMQ